MIRSFAAEVRAVCGTRSWRRLFPLMAALTLVAFFPLNYYAADAFGYFDPQSAAQNLEQAGVTASQLYTSGHSIGQLAALLFGAALITGEYRYGTAGPTFLARPHRWTVLAAKLAVAVLTAVALAAVAAAVTYLLVQRDPILMAYDEAEVLAERDIWPDLKTLEEVQAGIWRSVQVGLIGFPLWAAVGVGLGAIVRHQPLVVGLSLAYYVAAIVTPLQAQVPSVRAFVPVFTNATTVDVIYDARGDPASLLGSAATALLAVVLVVVGMIRMARRDGV